ALTSVLRRGGRRGAGGPRAVLLEARPLEATDERVVQPAVDLARDVAAGQRQVGGLSRPQELARDAEVERSVAELVAEAARLLAAAFRQPHRHRDVAVEAAVGGVLALAVAGEDGSPHQNKTLR